MTWIECSERLPAECESVLLYCHITKSMAVGWIAYDKEGKPLVYMINDFDKSESEAKLSEISFWMPLPNAPESFSGGRENEIPLFCKF